MWGFARSVGLRVEGSGGHEAKVYNGECFAPSTVYKALVAALTRRAVASAFASLPLFASQRTHAFGDAARFVPAIAKHGGRWDARVSGLRRIAWELQRRTSVEVVPEARPFSLTDPRLFEHPFLYFGSDGEYPALSDAEVEALRRYLTFGGFLLADAQDGSEGRGFDASFRRDLARILPQGASKLAPVSQSHVVFKSFFLLDSMPGRFLNKPYIEAAAIGQRLAVMYSQNDLAGAWSRDEGGDYEYEVTPGGEPQRELAVRAGINLCMYALCLDYKDDAVHLPLILQKRR